MKKKFLFLFLLFNAIFNNVAFAKPHPINLKAIKKLKQQAPGLMSKSLYKFVERANDLASGKNYTEAIKILKQALKSSYIKKGEKAAIMRALGFIYAQKKDFEKSLDWLNKSLKTKKLSYELHLSTLYIIAQITSSQNKLYKAKRILEKLFSLSEKANPQAYILYAICLLEGKKEKQALNYVEKAIAITNKPREGWLRFASFLYLKNKDYKNAKNVLEILVAQFPQKKLYWKHLAGVYIHLNENKKALATLNLAYGMGYLTTENEHLNLARLLLSENLPFQAAQLLEQSFSNSKIKKNTKNKEFIADAYLEARELKLSLKKFSNIIKASKNIDVFIKYAFLLLREEQWKKAEQALKKALNLYAQKKSQASTIKTSFLDSKDLYSKKTSNSIQQKNQSEKIVLNENLQQKNQNIKSKNIFSSLKFFKFKKASSNFDNKTENRESSTSSLLTSFDQKNLTSFGQKNLSENDSQQNSKFVVSKIHEAPKIGLNLKRQKDKNFNKDKKYKEEKDKIYLGLGIALFYQKKYKEALSHFQNSFKLNSKESDSFYWIQLTENMIKESKLAKNNIANKNIP